MISIVCSTGTLVKRLSTSCCDEYPNVPAKIDEILSDSTKFMKMDKDSTEDLKKQINQLIAQIKQFNKEYPLQNLTGHFEPGRIYIYIYIYIYR